MTRLCAYTVLTGVYEQLNEQPVAKASSSPFICLTDDQSLTSSTWTIQHIAPAFPMDPHRSQRMLKCDATQWLGDYDISLYIDNTVLLKATPEEIVARHLAGDAEMAACHHSFRPTLLDEFDAVIREGLVDPSRLFEQMNHYEHSYAWAFERRPLWGGLLIRRHHAPRVREAMAFWWRHILRYAYRDQLSLLVALEETGLRYDTLDLDNKNSWCHTWPVYNERNWYRSTPLTSLMPLRLQIKQLEREMAQMQKRLNDVSLFETALRRYRKLTSRLIRRE